MIVFPQNPNAIYVPLVPNGCCKAEFDSTYPIRLNGIINQDEYYQSINNINQAISSRKSMIFLIILVVLCIGGGFSLFIAGGITAVNSRQTGFPVLVGVGFGIFGLGMVIITVGCCIVQARQRTRMQQAVATESAKYSTRSPTPCSWRLDISSTWNGGYGHHQRTTVVYKLLIEIGTSVGSGVAYVPNQYNQRPVSSAPGYSQQNDVPPPPYPGRQSGTMFCSLCGAPRQNSSSKFCSSCGQPYNN